MQRYVIVHDESHEKDLIKGLALVNQYCKEADRRKNILMLIPSMKSLDGIIEDVLGPKVVKILKKDGSIPFNHDCILHLATKGTFRSLYQYDAVITVFIEIDALDNLDSERHGKPIVVVPWNMSELDDWIHTWNPKLIGEYEPEEVEDLPPEVKEALESLTIMVNLSTGLSHPSDRDDAIDAFTKLVKKRKFYDPRAIRIWAMQNGWFPKGANQLRDVAEAILQGRRLRKSR